METRDTAVSERISTKQGMNIRSLPTGVRLEYALQGPAAAEVLCFVHGVGANARQFDTQLTAFAGAYRVLALSLRGHGGSTAPLRASAADFSPRQLARDVLALLSELGIDKVHYVGNSLGGLVGYELLKLDSDCVLSLTTFGTTAELHSSALLRGTVVVMARWLGPRGLGWLLTKTASRKPDVRRIVGEMMRSARKDALVLLPQNIAAYDYRQTLQKRLVPMLLMRCEHDREINKQLQSTLEVLESDDAARVLDLHDAGHYANLDNPEAFNRVLSGFLAALTESPALAMPCS